MTRNGFKTISKHFFPKFCTFLLLCLDNPIDIDYIYYEYILIINPVFLEKPDN
jgi:hypothetical protein